MFELKVVETEEEAQQLLEANKTKTLEQNECYFRHRTTSSYF